MHILGYLLAGFIGFLLGTVLTCVLLCKKNLEAYTQISKNASSSLSNNIEAAKAMYKAQVEAYENGEDINAAPEEEEENTSNV